MKQKAFIPLDSKHLTGFTLMELLVVIAIIGLLATSSYIYMGKTKEKTRYVRAKKELNSIAAALEHWVNDNGSYPPDVNRGLPNGIETYLPDGDWPNGPWNQSVYDWDNWLIEDVLTYQISLRFCSAGANPADCLPPPIFPTFDTYSSVYYCISGSCRAHSSQPADHSGLCINCNQNESNVLWGGE